MTAGIQGRIQERKNLHGEVNKFSRGPEPLPPPTLAPPLGRVRLPSYDSVLPAASRRVSISLARVARSVLIATRRDRGGIRT